MKKVFMSDVQQSIKSAITAYFDDVYDQANQAFENKKYELAYQLLEMELENPLISNAGNIVPFWNINANYSRCCTSRKSWTRN